MNLYKMKYKYQKNILQIFGTFAKRFPSFGYPKFKFTISFRSIGYYRCNAFFSGIITSEVSLLTLSKINSFIIKSNPNV